MFSIGSQPGTSVTSDYSPDDVLHYPEDDVHSSKDDSNSPLLDKVVFAKHFQDMINLVTGYFSNAKPSLPTHSDDLILWLDSFGNLRERSQLVFLNCFDKLRAISKEVDEKFPVAAEDKKKASSCLPQWGQVYRFDDEESFHEAPKVYDSFLQLFDKDGQYVSLPFLVVG